MGYIQFIYNILVGGFSLVLIAVVVYRWIRYMKTSQDRLWLWDANLPLWWKIVKPLHGLSMLVLIIGGIHFIFTLSAFRFLIHPLINFSLLLGWMAVALTEVFLSLSVSQRAQQLFVKKFLFLCLLPGHVLLGIVLISSIPEAHDYPAAEDCIVLEMPVEGEWMAAHAGGSESVNYHCAVKSQNYAIDIVKQWDNGHSFQGNGDTVTKFAAFGQPLFSPVDGRVVKAIDSLPDMKPMDMDSQTSIDRVAGNHVFIAINGQTDRYVALAHIKSGTVRVKTGDVIKAGQQIGEVGNSGNTSEPHLHMHVQDHPEINYDAIAFPFRFRKMERKRWLSWDLVENGFLIRNDRFRKVD